MKKEAIFLFSALLVLFTGCGQTNSKQIRITPQELSTWETFGKGKSTVNGNELIVEETEGSDGYFMIGPKASDKDFVLNYKVKALSESTVLINLFAVIQDPMRNEFQLPSDTAAPREVWQWRTKMKHYNLTFNNSSHGNKPFFFKNNSPYSRGFYESLPENIMEADEWYSVEIGKKASRLWFKLNGKTHFDIEDCNPLDGGRLLFRISGTTDEQVIFAKAAYRDIVISYE